MSLLFIRTCNKTFESRDNGGEYDQPDLALAYGVQAAMAIVAEEIVGGRTVAAVEVRIEREDGECVLRSLVTAAVSSLVVARDRPSDCSIFG